MKPPIADLSLNIIPLCILEINYLIGYVNGRIAAVFTRQSVRSLDLKLKGSWINPHW